ncbi:MAG: CBS domain-containing protein [Candidatus Bathyarchaeia archaeon]
MTAVDIRSRILVKDVMSSPAITVEEEDTADKAARLMEKHNIGCVIVSTRDGKPIGIITEKDLVDRLVAKDIQPSKMMVKDIMSAPLVTIDADKTITEAARRMSRLNVRRLGVMHKGNLAGIITSKDILAVTPELIEIIQERARINAAEEIEETPPSAGYCENCGSWSENLKEVEGSFLCDECSMERMSVEY